MIKNIKCKVADYFFIFVFDFKKKKIILGCFLKIDVIGKKCLEYNFN